jgi:hypothetical protein
LSSEDRRIGEIYGFGFGRKKSINNLIEPGSRICNGFGSLVGRLPGNNKQQEPGKIAGFKTQTVFANRF